MYTKYMPCRYTSFHDLESRLNRTVCRWDGTFYFVGVCEDLTIRLFDTVSEQLIHDGLDPSDPRFDISSPEVGYMNITLGEENHVVYMTRPPMKRWKQGLDPAGVHYFNISGASSEITYRVDPFHTPGFIDSLEGNFPSLQSALGKFNSGFAGDIAISQDIALGKLPSGMILVYYKMENVGWIVPGTNEITMESKDTSWVVKRLLGRFGLNVIEKMKGAA